MSRKNLIEVDMTKQRAVILDIIRSDKCHHTADEIFKLARERLPRMSLATVYNNLKALEKERLIRRITGDGARDRYDGSFIPHGHLVCERCDKVWDFNIDGFDSILLDAVGLQFNSYELKVRCLCPECENQEAELTAI